MINRVAARISLRMEQLSNLPTNMPEDLRIQAQIELRMLRVLNFQRQLRTEVFIAIDLCERLRFLFIPFLNFLLINFFFVDNSVYQKRHYLGNRSERESL